MTAPATRGGYVVVHERLSKAGEAIAAVAASSDAADRIVKLALLQVRKSNDLQRCSPDSIVEAVIRIASWGLEPGRTAHLVAYGGTCTPIPDYKGVIQLVVGSGAVRDVRARVVYQGDEYDLAFGTEDRITHKPAPPDQRGEVIAAYAVASLPGGGTHSEWMWRSDIDAIRQRSRAGSKGPWATDFAEMAKKTVIKRLCKQLPQTTAQLRDALDVADDDPAPPEPLPPGTPVGVKQLASGGYTDPDLALDRQLASEDGDPYLDDTPL